MIVWVRLHFKCSGLRCEMTITPLEWALGRDTSRWSLMGIPSFIWRVLNCFFKYKQFVRDFVMYKLSNLNHNLVVVSSSTTSRSTSLPKHNRIALCDFSISSSFSSLDTIVSKASLPFNVLDNLCWNNKACILMRHKLKSFLPSNFSTSNIVVILGLITLALIPICCDNGRFHANKVNSRTQR